MDLSKLYELSFFDNKKQYGENTSEKRGIDSDKPLKYFSRNTCLDNNSLGLSTTNGFGTPSTSVNKKCDNIRGPELTHQREKTQLRTVPFATSAGLAFSSTKIDEESSMRPVIARQRGRDYASDMNERSFYIFSGLSDKPGNCAYTCVNIQGEDTRNLTKTKYTKK
jgi:hypothetical protein